MKTKPWPLPPIDDKLRQRLASGARLRTGMMEQIERGEEPAPAYRVEWLRQTAKEIVLLLARMGEDFNATHSDDAISLADALDSLASARAMLMTMAPRDLKYP
jgi:hypothetical protein